VGWRGLLPALALAVTASTGADSRPAVASADGGVVNSVGMRMVLVPAGSFLMGSPPGAPLRQEEEVPHRVTLTRAFRMSATEVTRRQWFALMPTSPGLPQDDDIPVASVSWREAQEFCARLSQKDKVAYRLPTEAEWEYACRAGGQDDSGGAELEATAWYADNSDGAAHGVGSRKPNPWGLFDMLGNVAEWTQDVYAPYPRLDLQTDPGGPATGTSHVVRGGSWRSFPPALRCAARTGTPASYQLPQLGFRVVQQVE